MTDQLLKSFIEFEISIEEKGEIRGGKLKPNGCRQSGSLSYIDYIDAGGTQRCDALKREPDESGWCDSLFS